MRDHRDRLAPVIRFARDAYRRAAFPWSSMLYDPLKRKDSADIQRSHAAFPRALTGTACFYLLDLTQRLSRSRPHLDFTARPTRAALLF